MWLHGAGDNPRGGKTLFPGLGPGLVTALGLLLGGDADSAAAPVHGQGSVARNRARGKANRLGFPGKCLICSEPPTRFNRAQQYPVRRAWVMV
mgnify:CR=1 FL=1